MLDWTQTMLTAGEAFSGAESGTLRDAIARQSGRFFEAYHAANLQASRLHATAGLGCNAPRCAYLYSLPTF